MKKQCYTIVELLVVIAIMAVIIGIAIPGLNNLINGNKVERAAKQLASAIGKARSEAIVTNRKVALLFPVKHASNNNIKTQYINSSYAIVVLKRDGATPDPEKNSDFKWERLPGNVYISVTNSFSAGDDFFDQDGIESNSSEWDTEVEVNGNAAKYNRIFQKSSGTKTVRMLVFNPDGTIGSSNLNFFLAEGLVKMNGEIEPDDKANPKKPAGAIGFELNRFTGRVKYYETL